MPRHEREPVTLLESDDWSLRSALECDPVASSDRSPTLYIKHINIKKSNVSRPTSTPCFYLARGDSFAPGPKTRRDFKSLEAPLAIAARRRLQTSLSPTTQCHFNRINTLPMPILLFESLQPKEHAKVIMLVTLLLHHLDYNIKDFNIKSKFCHIKLFPYLPRLRDAADVAAYSRARTTRPAASVPDDWPDAPDALLL
jgi:hypothetical protein